MPGMLKTGYRFQFHLFFGNFPGDLLYIQFLGQAQCIALGHGANFLQLLQKTVPRLLFQNLIIVIDLPGSFRRSICQLACFLHLAAQPIGVQIGGMLQLFHCIQPLLPLCHFRRQPLRFFFSPLQNISGRLLRKLIHILHGSSYCLYHIADYIQITSAIGILFRQSLFPKSSLTLSFQIFRLFSGIFFLYRLQFTAFLLCHFLHQLIKGLPPLLLLRGKAFFFILGRPQQFCLLRSSLFRTFRFRQTPFFRKSLAFPGNLLHLGNRILIRLQIFVLPAIVSLRLLCPA